MALLVVGSFALDTIRMPDGKVHDDVLGGSGTYFSLASAFYAPTRVVGAVGLDFPQKHVDLLRRRGVDTAGLVLDPAGTTFRWEGTYAANMDDRVTDNLHFGVMGAFRPRVDGAAALASHVFLACAQPALQMDVLRQMKKKPVAVCDTIQVYIENDRADLDRVFKACDGVVINDAEARLLFGDENMVRCARALVKGGPRFAVVKKGAHGAVLATKRDGVFPVPALPLEKIADPTGAGDAFAGGFMGWLHKKRNLDTATLRQALLHATATASYACEGVGPSRLARVKPAELAARVRAFAALLRAP